jgi:hypothetical protein
MFALTIFVLASRVPAADAGLAGIPAWARRYNVTCSHCHAPALPRLNTTGIHFRWAGYRMPEDIGRAISVTQVSNYLAARAQISYAWEKTAGRPASSSEMSEPAVQLFYAGPFGKHFGGWFELSREAGEVGSNAAVTGVWGNARNHGGFRVGQVPYFLESGVAGFDRPIGIEAPLAASTPVSAAIPFALEGDQKAVELFYVTGPNRLAAQLLNGSHFDGTDLVASGSTRHDVGLVDQLLLGEKGSALYLAGYYGSVIGLDSSRASARSNFWRVAASANAMLGSDSSSVELLGGVVYGRDLRLPVGAIYSHSDNRGYGYWLSARYGLAAPALTLFGRYEFLDPDTRVSFDANRRIVAGLVLPVSLPQYLRLAVEYRLDNPEASGAPTTSAATAEVQLIF